MRKWVLLCLSPSISILLSKKESKVYQNVMSNISTVGGPDQYCVVFISALLWSTAKCEYTHTKTWNGKEQFVNNTSCIITQICLLFLWNKTYLVLRYNLENEKVMVHNNIYSHIESYEHLNWNHMKDRKGKCFLNTVMGVRQSW